MLTLRFEVDSFSSGDGGATFVTCANSYRVRRQKDGSADVLVANEHGVDVAHPVSFSIDGYQRCYVMNPSGSTIDKIEPRQNQTTA